MAVTSPHTHTPHVRHISCSVSLRSVGLTRRTTRHLNRAATPWEGRYVASPPHRRRIRQLPLLARCWFGCFFHVGLCVFASRDVEAVEFCRIANQDRAVFYGNNNQCDTAGEGRDGAVEYAVCGCHLGGFSRLRCPGAERRSTAAEELFVSARRGVT